MKKTIQIKCKGADLLPYDSLMQFQGDLKTLSKKNLEKLKTSIIKSGFRFPFYIWVNNEQNKIINGHQRDRVLKSLKEDGWEIPLLPVVYIYADNEQEAREAILENSSQYGEWNKLELETWLDGIDDEIRDTLRFVDKEITIAMNRETLDDDEIEETEYTGIIKEGDLFECGCHRVLCGDSTRIEDVERLMDGNKADMAINDPPYGIEIVKTGKIGGDKPFGKTTGKITNGYVGADSICKANIYKKIKNDDTIETALESYQRCIDLKIKNIILWGGNYYAHKLPPASCWIIWDKETAGTFGDGEIAWTNIKRSVGICRHKWSGMIKASEHGQKRVHPTQKPIALYEWILIQYGKASNKIMDLFLGSGSTLIACEKTDRICYGMELEPHYCEVILNRYIDWCNKNDIEATVKINGQPYTP